MAFSPGNNKALIVLVAVSVLGSLGAAAGTGYFVMSRTRSASSGEAPKAKEADKERARPPETIYSLGEMVINLSDGGELRYAKISIAVGLAEKLEPEALKPNEPLLKDAVIHVVSNRRFAELHRPGGLEKLKIDLRTAMAGRLPHATISDIYLESFAMQ